MIFVINDLKYDTRKMEKISDKVKKSYKFFSIIVDNFSCTYNCILWRSKKGRWLLTHDVSGYARGEAIDEIEAKELLKKYDLDAYEKLFEELEEA
jgi:hypothetical protein